MNKEIKLFIQSLSIVCLSIGIVATLVVKSTEDKIKNQIESYTFSEGSPIEGMKLKINTINCPYLSRNSCELNDVTVYSQKNDGTIVNIFTAKEVDIKKKESKTGTFLIKAKEINLSENFKKSIFLNHKDENLTKIGEKIHNSLFPFSISIDANTNILKKDLAEIIIDIILENRSLKLDTNTKFITENKPYIETIEVKKEDPNRPGEYFVSEMKGSFPMYVKMEKLKYSIENKNIPDLLYNFYKLNSLAFKDNPRGILAFNSFYLGSLTEKELTFEEFSKRLPLRIHEFSESVPRERKAIKKHLSNLSKIFTSDYKQITLVGKNIDGSSIEKLNMSLNLKDYREQLKVFYDAYSIKTSIK